MSSVKMTYALGTFNFLVSQMRTDRSAGQRQRPGSVTLPGRRVVRPHHGFRRPALLR
jgi:hypothetical protein